MPTIRTTLGGCAWRSMSGTTTSWASVPIRAFIGPGSSSCWQRRWATTNCLPRGQAIPQTLKSEVAEYGETLRPDWIVNDPATKKARLLVQVYPRSQSLTKPVQSSRWKTSPDTRMMQLLHDTGIRLGIVTNGDHWMLVNAPKNETTGYASWYANLWLEEPITLRAFRTLLVCRPLLQRAGQRNARSPARRERRRPAGSHRSAWLSGPQGGRGLDPGARQGRPGPRAEAAGRRGREDSLRVGPHRHDAAGVPVLRRGAGTAAPGRRPLRQELRRQHAAGATAESRRISSAKKSSACRYDAWTRLLTTFRAVYAGAKHDRLKLPAYGGSLFNPDRFPFLEGRKLGTSWKNTEATPLPVSNRTVLHLLEALQVLQIGLPAAAAEARKLSFRSLDIEQIGHVYEGLLDHTAKRAAEPVLGLAGDTRTRSRKSPWPNWRRSPAKGEKELLKFLKDETGRSESALQEGAEGRA